MAPPTELIRRALWVLLVYPTISSHSLRSGSAGAMAEKRGPRSWSHLSKVKRIFVDQLRCPQRAKTAEHEGWRFIGLPRTVGGFGLPTGPIVMHFTHVSLRRIV